MSSGRTIRTATTTETSGIRETAGRVTMTIQLRIKGVPHGIASMTDLVSSEG
jgi:hypothetical protein